MKIDFEKIKVSNNFLSSVPNENKVRECRLYYNVHGRLDREIVVDYNSFIIDGYIGYLILKEYGYSGEIKVKQSNRREKRWYRKRRSESYKNIPSIYVFGNHQGSEKEFVWRVPKSKRDQFSLYSIGDTIPVCTRYGIKTITITDIRELDKSPVDIRVKKIFI